MITSHGSSLISAGARVMSADGKQLGSVKEVRTDKFLVDARWAADYWLGTETVDNVADGLVQLIITREAVGTAKLTRSVEGPGINRDIEDFNGPAPQNRPPPSL